MENNFGKREEREMKKEQAAVAAAAEAGFTLIEILLVVVIIGMLAAVATTSLHGRMAQAQKSAAAQSIEAIRMAVKMYEVDTGKYPSSLQNLISKGSENNWNGPYLEKAEIPKDPWGNEFQYSVQGGQFTVTSAGLDGTFGTEDDVK